MSEGR